MRPYLLEQNNYKKWIDLDVIQTISFDPYCQTIYMGFAFRDTLERFGYKSDSIQKVYEDLLVAWKSV